LASQAPFSLPGCTYSVDEIPRRGVGFEVYWKLIHEWAFTGSGGPQLVIPKNPLRIRAVLYAPPGNSGTIFLCGPQGSIGTGVAGYTGYNALEMEPGTGWEIDDTIAAIFAFCAIGAGDQNLRWYEAADDPRIPLLIAR
jgi:hypothetical protein